MATRLFEIALSVPCATQEEEEGATAAVEAVLDQLFTVALMLSHVGIPRLSLEYVSSTSGRVEVAFPREQPMLDE